ncbi:hypothetical protein HPB49_013378 [Dermacentor silvarum]|uniref:Uncharacterized protein n=1 Tax=Dermacentor silvarum TaxID=543639 RepID=A0ACB8C3W8_DERSI|nr:hypothetical protein HPB49_013378 [Dermacentor silvarum]
MNHVQDKVCERHFRASDIRTSSSYVDSKTGKVVESKLKIARLSPDAVPCVFPNCTAYLSAPATATSREAPDEKRMRLEAASLREAVAASFQTHEEEESGNNIDTFQALCFGNQAFQLLECYFSTHLRVFVFQSCFC